MTKIKFLRIACLMSAATMLATCINSGTMAKYTSSGTASGLKLTVANWDVEVAEQQLGVVSPIDLSGLDWHIEYEADASAEPPANGTIAPGTWGYAEIPVENKSEVDAKIRVDYSSLKPTVTNGDSTGMFFGVVVQESEPSEGSVDWFEYGAEITAEAEGEVTRGTTAYIYVCYEWEFGEGENDIEDTEKGKSSIDGDRIEVNFGTLKITAEQSDGKTS